MKRFVVFITALLVSSSSFAQNNSVAKTTTTPQKSGAKFHQPAVGGFITDARRHPIPGVKAFIYQADSTIIASGYTDSTGYYETNSILPGTYNLKFVYPSASAVMVKGVIVKSGVTTLSFNTNPPASDTAYNYADFLPKKEPKKKTAK